MDNLAIETAVRDRLFNRLIASKAPELAIEEAKSLADQLAGDVAEIVTALKLNREWLEWLTDNAQTQPLTPLSVAVSSAEAVFRAARRVGMTVDIEAIALRKARRWKANGGGVENGVVLSEEERDELVRIARAAGAELDTE